MPNDRVMRLKVGKTLQLEDSNADRMAERLVSAIQKLAGCEVEIPGPTPTAGQPFLVAHDLDYVPTRVSTVDAGDLGGSIYATAEDKLTWTTSQVMVRSTIANDVNLTIRLTGRPE